MMLLHDLVHADDTPDIREQLLRCADNLAVLCYAYENMSQHQEDPLEFLNNFISHEVVNQVSASESAGTCGRIHLCQTVYTCVHVHVAAVSSADQRLCECSQLTTCP